MTKLVGEEEEGDEGVSEGERKRTWRRETLGRKNESRKRKWRRKSVNKKRKGKKDEDKE